MINYRRRDRLGFLLLTLRRLQTPASYLLTMLCVIITWTPEVDLAYERFIRRDLAKPEGARRPAQQRALPGAP